LARDPYRRSTTPAQAARRISSRGAVNPAMGKTSNFPRPNINYSGEEWTKEGNKKKRSQSQHMATKNPTLSSCRDLCNCTTERRRKRGQKQALTCGVCPSLPHQEGGGTDDPDLSRSSAGRGCPLGKEEAAGKSLGWSILIIIGW
jgi:hypothetical protein